MFAVITSLVITCAPAVSPGGQLPGDAPPSPRSTAPDIAIKAAERTQVVYQEHLGPYWTVGPVFARVQEYMLEHGQLGPMFIRYLDSPSTVGAEKLRAEVGFFVNELLQTNSPFRSAVREPGYVAAVVVEGPIAGPPQYHAMLRRWALARGHTPLGGVTEIFHSPQDVGATRQYVEVQMPIRPRATREVPTRRTPTTEPVQAWSPEPSPAPTAASVERRASRDREAPKPPQRTPKTLPAATSESQTRSEPVDSVKELVHQQRFNRIAELLMPPDIPFPQAFQLWFGQVVFRIGAIAGGIAQVYPEEKTAVAALSEAIRRRYDSISVDFALDPRDQPVLRVDPHSDRYAARKLCIIHELDTILGGIALTRLDGGAAEGQLIDIVQRVYDLISAREAAGSEHVPG